MLNWRAAQINDVLEGQGLLGLATGAGSRSRSTSSQKIIQPVKGDYAVPVHATVFHLDEPKEDEHTAAHLFRRDAHICFAHEVLSHPWPNAMLKRKNNPD